MEWSLKELKPQSLLSPNAQLGPKTGIIMGKNFGMEGTSKKRKFFGPYPQSGLMRYLKVKNSEGVTIRFLGYMWLINQIYF